MTTATATAERYLRAPRLPKSSPVVILHVRADNDRNGNPRRAFVVLTTSGRLVEAMDEGYGGETTMQRRYPWFNHGTAHALNLRSSYVVSIDATPSEYKRWLRQDSADNRDVETPELLRLRAMATRCAQYGAVRDALSTIRRGSAEHKARELRAEREGRENHYGDTRAPVVYHQHPSDGGDAVSDYLRRAINAFVRAGMIERAGDVGRYNARSVGHYRTTDTTPRLED